MTNKERLRECHQSICDDNCWLDLPYSCCNLERCIASFDICFTIENQFKYMSINLYGKSWLEKECVYE